MLILLNAGADASIPRKAGRTPMGTAKDKSHKGIIKLLKNVQ